MRRQPDAQKKHNGSCLLQSRCGARLRRHRRTLQGYCKQGAKGSDCGHSQISRPADARSVLANLKAVKNLLASPCEHLVRGSHITMACQIRSRTICRRYMNVTAGAGDCSKHANFCSSVLSTLSTTSHRNDAEQRGRRTLAFRGKCHHCLNSV